MATVSTVLNGARYDLRNYGDIDFDSKQMIHFLNRALKILDYTLAAHNSDWTLNKDDVTLLEGDSQVNVPTGAFNLREVWIDTSRLENKDQMAIYYKAAYRESDTGRPNFWTHSGDTIMFEVAADEDYTVTTYYDKFATEITSELSLMPYEGRFDEAVRESVVLMCQGKKYKNINDVDGAYAQLFESLIHQDTINRKFVKKTYRLDF
jgi:hypothetical protein